MRILHTSDLHVGKRLMGRDRLVEQALVLDEIVDICEREQIELVLVAGDVFDTYTPSSEAEELFYAKIKNFAGQDRAVLLISGNHDDGTRLSAVSPFSQEQGVYIVGNARTPIPVAPVGRKTRPVQSDKGYVIFENEKGEKAFVATLPYPNEARFKEEKSDLPYVERMQGWINEGVSANVNGYPSILLAHIFVAGGKVSESEREIDLGGARALPIEALPQADYIALGHLHKKQKLGKGHCYYSGSPLQYSFDEVADKTVKVFDLTPNGVENLKDVPLQSGKKLIRLEAESVQSAEALLKSYPEAWVELKLLLNAPLTQSDSAALAAHENLVSLLTEVHTAEEIRLESRKGLTDSALFDAYYQSAYNAAPKPELKSLFLEILSEMQETGGGV
ncbi:MAG: exonuclease subunit SbcD [Clostridia bacterium]|nr:exonuclease subunit SbcD [Clostridia bacterium]